MVVQDNHQKVIMKTLGGASFDFYDPALGTDAFTSDSLLGFVADYGRDGWTVGVPPILW